MRLLEAWSELHFLRPIWGLALPLVLLPWLARRADKSKHSPWAAVVDAELLPHLLSTGHSTRQNGVRLAASLSLLLVITALAGPAFRLAPQAQMSREAGLVIALDLSAGMRAADVSPNRLARARFEIADLLRQRADGQTALIAYAGEAFTVAPMTDDARTLESLLAALEPEVMPVAGQRPERALSLAAELIRNAGLPGGDVLLVTYAGSEAALPVAGRLAAEGVRVSVLLVGTDAGAPVPGEQGGFRSDDSGRVLIASRDRPAAQRLVSAGGGVLVEAEADDRDTRELAALFEEGAGQPGALRDDASLRYVDEGPWLLLLALLPTLIWLRRAPHGRLALVVGGLLVGGATPPAQAAGGLWESLWSRPDQSAWRALEAGDAETARRLAAAPELRAAAAYRSGDYAAAAEDFAAATQDATTLYNRGTALARAGDLEQALAVLEQALEQAPDLQDARYNRDQVAQALARQREQQQSERSDSDQQGDSGSEGGESGETDSEPSEEGKSAEDGSGDGERSEGDEQGASSEDEGSAGEGDGDAEPGAELDRERAAADAQREAIEQALAEQQEAGDEASASRAAEEAIAQEQLQATEQLLRQIPDDPGALLRRKFALEHRRRVLEGEGR